MLFIVFLVDIVDEQTSN